MARRIGMLLVCGGVVLFFLPCHRSGLPRNSDYHESLAVAHTAALLRQVESIPSAWAAFPAGHRYKYSNVGYNVLGRIIENVRDELFAVYMTESALPEYGMDHSAFLIDFLPTNSSVATGYAHHWGRYRPYAAQDIIQLASGNLYTSAADLSTFMITAVSDLSYEICLRYPDMSEIPARCAVLVGEYDNCEVRFIDNALLMTGVGYLVECAPGILTVVGGPYDGETVVVDPVSKSLRHQGVEYRKAIP